MGDEEELKADGRAFMEREGIKDDVKALNRYGDTLKDDMTI